MGSTLALGDSSGSLTTAYTYGPYGQTSQTGTASSNSNNYTGREQDAGNLYYYRARYYNTELNRFISQDPVGLNGGINRYIYVRGNPNQFVDPSGLLGVGVGFVGSVEGGFIAGSSLYGGVGFGFFSGNKGLNSPPTSSAQFGGFTTIGGGAGALNWDQNATFTPGYQFQYGDGHSTNPSHTVTGANIGMGFNAFITNAAQPSDLAGAAYGISIVTPIGSLAISGNNGIWMTSVAPPIVGSRGTGLSISTTSSYTRADGTNDARSGGCD